MKTAILGINPCQWGLNFHDPSCVLIVDGTIVAAAEEERFIRRKSAAGCFPRNAVEYVLSYAGITVQDLTEVAVAYSPSLRRGRLRPALLAHVATLSDYLSDPCASNESLSRACLDASASFSQLYREQLDWCDSFFERHVRQELAYGSLTVRFLSHHLCHAESAWLSSYDPECAALVVDGIGESASASGWTTLKGQPKCMFELFTPASLGYFYAAVTEYLGFSAWRDEGKTMALAPYGTRDDKVANALRRLIEPCNEGYRCGEFGGQLVTDSMQFNPVTACLALEGLLGVPRRDVNQQVMGFFATVACEAQALLESCLLALSKRVLDMSGRRSLCAAGGVFLNCKASAVLRSAVPTNLLYVQPVAGDAGVALGAAVHRAKAHGNKIQPLNHLLLGPDAPSTDGIRNMLDKWAVPYAISKESHAVIATMLLEGNIVFVFDGRAEFGPRALGSRSIIADPRDRKLRDRVNNCVKRRETWRPFGPSILEEHACFVLQDYQANRSLFMVEAFKLKSPWNERVPAVFHEIDGTVRPQTVCKETQPWFYSVIDAFRRETGVPMVLNTSLNDRGDPLVHHPADALRMFVSSSADVLYLSGVIILKEQHRGRYAHFFD